jgi:hypothetical protein
MRQKYTICREDKEKRLSIKEYAILEKVSRNPRALMSAEDFFSFLGEETYDSAAILDSMEKGANTLIEVLRTERMYPIWPNAIKIAESVMHLYNLEGGGTVDLIFDDIEQIEKNETMADE